MLGEPKNRSLDVTGCGSSYSPKVGIPCTLYQGVLINYHALEISLTRLDRANQPILFGKIFNGIHRKLRQLRNGLIVKLPFQHAKSHLKFALRFAVHIGKKCSDIRINPRCFPLAVQEYFCCLIPKLQLPILPAEILKRIGVSGWSGKQQGLALSASSYKAITPAGCDIA